MLSYIISLILILNGLILPMKVEPTKQTLYDFSKVLNESYVDMGFKEITPVIIFQNLQGYRGGTSVPFFQRNLYCGKNISIGVQYRYPSYKYYGTVDILSTLAHEMGHVYQGVTCESSTVEAGATLLSLKALSISDDATAQQAFYWYLRELLVLKATDEACSLGEAGDMYFQKYDFLVSCDVARERRAYTRAIDWLLSDDVITASSLPVQISTDTILEAIK